MITIHTDNLRGELAPLYRRFSGHYQPQPAHVCLDENGNVRADYCGIIGTGQPMDVWLGRTRRWSVNPEVNGDQIADLLESDKVRALLERVHAGHSVEWDGSNYVGRLTDDAREASDALGLIFEDETRTVDGGGVWGAGDWIDPLGADDLLKKGEGLVDAAERLVAEAKDERAAIEGGKGDMLDAIEWRLGHMLQHFLPGLRHHHLTALRSLGWSDYDIAEYIERFHDERIGALWREAGSAGDLALADLCVVALDVVAPTSERADAALECLRVLENGEAAH